jgi:hypothetical protein
VLSVADARADREINMLVGDASWAGRTEPGDEVTRVRAHLAFAHDELATRDVSALAPAQRLARAESLADLSRYIERGEFPRRTKDGYEGRRPRFIDDRGVHCAVGQLIADSGDEDLAQAINARFEYAHVREMESPALAAWASTHGFTVDELALIQPSYSSLPTPESVRRDILEAKDIVALRCAKKHSPMKNLLVIAINDDDGKTTVRTKSTDPFAQCVVRSMGGGGGGAYMGSPREFSIGVDLYFTSPQKQLEKRVAEWAPSCTARPGVISREASVDVTSTREGLRVHAKSSPSNALVDECLAADAKRVFADFGAGAWNLRSSQRIKIWPRVHLDADTLKFYAIDEATNCLPTPAANATSMITVTAKPDDPAFTIQATGSPDFATCMSEALNKRLVASFQSTYSDGKQWVQYFRIDAAVRTSIKIQLESQASRTKRLEEQERQMKSERYGF